MDDFVFDEYLEHHGVMGMKWGRRKAETLARYAREAGGKAASATKKTVTVAGKQIKNQAGKASTAAVNKIKEHRENKAVAKSKGFSRYSEYKKVRKRTLASHDPAVVSKGLITLSDTELSNKIKRLEAEKRIIDMVPQKPKSLGRQTVERFATTAANTVATTLGQQLASRILSGYSSPSNPEPSSSGEKPKTETKAYSTRSQNATYKKRVVRQLSEPAVRSNKRTSETVRAHIVSVEDIPMSQAVSYSVPVFAESASKSLPAPQDKKNRS